MSILPFIISPILYKKKIEDFGLTFSSFQLYPLTKNFMFLCYTIGLIKKDKNLYYIFCQKIL